MCREFAARYVEAHKREFKRLGVFGQWDKPYLTMDPHDEASIAGAFIDFLEKGYVYRGLKPVYWCIYDRTALAEAEVEYEDHTSPSIWVKFPVVAGAKTSPAGRGRERAHLDHHALDASRQPRARVSSGLRIRGRRNFRGQTLACERTRERARGRIENRSSRNARRLEGQGIRGRRNSSIRFSICSVPGVLADYVTLDQGSGIVHTAPGHGADDFRTGQKYGLEAYAPQDDEGRFVEGLPEYKGKTVFEANPIVIEILKKRGMLVGERKLTHSYPHCWRCHNPVIFRATEQWFIGLDQGRPAPESARGNRESEMAAGLGTRPHARHGRRASRLVHFAAAFLGRAADRFLLRRVRKGS